MTLWLLVQAYLHLFILIGTLLIDDELRHLKLINKKQILMLVLTDKIWTLK